MAQPYNTYVSPISRFQAIRGGRLANEAQSMQNEAQSMQNQQNAQMQPLRMQAMQNQVTAQNQAISESQRDQLIRQHAADAMEIIDLPDQQLVAELPKRFPGFLEAAKANGASISDIRNRLGGIVQGGISLGVLKAPAAEKSPPSWQTQQGVGPDGKPMFFQINPQTGETRPIQGVAPSPKTEPKPTNWQIKEGIGPDGNPAYFAFNPETQETKPIDQFAPPPKSGETITTNAEGGVTITRGAGVGQTGDMSNPTRSKIEQKIVSLDEMNARLNRVESYFNPEILTYGRQIRNKVSNIKDKMGFALSADDQAKLQESTRFNTELDQLFNAYRKEITGAAASVQELDRLRASMINSDMGPAQFKAAFDQFTRQIREDTALYKDLLSKGVSPETAGRAVDDKNAEKSAAKTEQDKEAEIMAKYGLQ